MKTPKVFKCIGFAGIGLAAASLFVLLSMYLWNGLIPELFNGPVLNFWQTAGLLVLSKIFFSGFSCGGRHGRQHRHMHGHCCNDATGGHDSWWKRFHERCQCKKTDSNESSCC